MKIIIEESRQFHKTNLICNLDGLFGPLPQIKGIFRKIYIQILQTQ